VELRPGKDPRVVTGGETVEAKLAHPREHQVEPHERVAAHARVGRASREVVAVERLDHALAELPLQVPAVIRNVEEARHAPSVLDRGERTAPAVTRRLVRVVARPLLQGHPDDVVPLRLEERRRDR
jgi:hypothetical protein